MKKKVYLHNKSLLREFLKDAKTYSSEEFKDLPEDALVITPIGYTSPLDRHDMKNVKFEMVLENLYEGSSTLIRLLYDFGFLKSVLRGDCPVICSGEAPEQCTALNINYFLYKTGQANLHNRDYKIKITEKPYTFLCLNNRPRPHRTKLLEYLDSFNLLDNALWSNLLLNDSKNGEIVRLPKEFDMSELNISENISLRLMEWDQWLAGPAVPKQYDNTYFSVIAESTIKHRYSFFTEKIYKPIIMGHPFITLASKNYYPDLRKIFRTFEPYIDEVFSMHNDWESRTSAVVREIDRLVYDRNLVNFLKNVNPICRENQERFWKLYDEYPQTTEIKLRKYLSQLGGQV